MNEEQVLEERYEAWRIRQRLDDSRYCEWCGRAKSPQHLCEGLDKWLEANGDERAHDGYQAPE